MTHTGADHLIANALHNGIDVCFANPGTTELHLIQALDRAGGMRSVLGAFEGVCSGAADGYARMAGKPALGLYHLGPGFANSLANQHNARRHGTPMINIIGDQASWHLAADAPLTSDIDALSGWTGATVHTQSSQDTGEAMARAVGMALSGPDHIVNLIIPNDHAWDRAEEALHEADVVAPQPLDDHELATAASLLGQPGAVLILGGPALSTDDLRLAAAIARRCGATPWITKAAKLEAGRHVPSISELPYFPQPLRTALADATAAVILGPSDPVTFFGYPDVPSYALPESAERLIAPTSGLDLTATLRHLADLVGAVLTDQGAVDPLPEPEPGVLTARSMGTAFCHAIGDHNIVVAEAITSGGAYRHLANQAAPHTMLSVLGGAIGGGLPTAVGAAVACPDRPVLALQADGSALYTIQSLWTMAREALDVTVVICANRRYQILDVELAMAGIDIGAAGRSLTDLGQPPAQFATIAHGFGVPARTAATTEDFVAALAWAQSEPGPHLIEAEL